MTVSMLSLFSRVPVNIICLSPTKGLTSFLRLTRREVAISGESCRKQLLDCYSITLQVPMVSNYYKLWLHSVTWSWLLPTRQRWKKTDMNNLMATSVNTNNYSNYHPRGDSIALKVENISKIYNSSVSKVVSLRRIDFSVSKGEFVSIVGPSGSVE